MRAGSDMSSTDSPCHQTSYILRSEMAENTSPTTDEHDDEEMAAFVRLARSAVSNGDPAPSEVSDLAKLAFAFRDVETVDSVDTSELAGVRSGSAISNVMQAKNGPTTVIWSVEDDLLSGVVHGEPGARVWIQSPDLRTAVDVEVEDGSFEASAPSGAYRLIVDDGTEWATPWAD